MVKCKEFGRKYKACIRFAWLPKKTNEGWVWLNRYFAVHEESVLKKIDRWYRTQKVWIEIYSHPIDSAFNDVPLEKQLSFFIERYKLFKMKNLL